MQISLFDKLTHFSLCTGVGGLDLAAEWAGFETIGQSEIDDYASKVLAKNFKGVKNYGDIRTITAERLAQDGIERGAITVISAGIPCQPYSFAGKGLGDGDERDLEQELIRVVNELRPKWVIVENTPGLFARKNQRYFHRILSDLSALGYFVAWGMWGACDVGANHKRERVFIVGHSNGNNATEKQQIQAQNFESCGVCSNVPNANSESGAGLSGRAEKEIAEFRGYGKFELSSWWQTEPDVGRVVNGCPARVDRLRCLGNMVVPQQAFPIFKAIADYEKEN